MYVCVCPPHEAKNNWRARTIAIQFHLKALAVDIMHSGSSNEMRPQLYLRKTNTRLY